MIPGDLLSAFPHRQFHTLPGLLDSWAALPNSYPNACMPMQGGSLYHFYDGLWYDPAERRTHDLPCERRTRYRLSQPDTVDSYGIGWTVQFIRSAKIKWKYNTWCITVPWIVKTCADSCFNQDNISVFISGWLNTHDQQLYERVMSISSKFVKQTLQARPITKDLRHKHINDKTSYMYFTWLLIKSTPESEL